MNIHALSGIQTHNPKNQAASSLRLKRHGHWDCHKYALNLYNIQSQVGEFVLFVRLKMLLLSFLSLD
jgi:hypothetical protein